AQSAFAFNARFHDPVESEIVKDGLHIDADSAISLIRAHQYSQAMEKYRQVVLSDRDGTESRRIEKEIKPCEVELVRDAEVAWSRYGWVIALTAYTNATILSGDDHRYQTRIAQIKELQKKQPDLANMENATEAAFKSVADKAEKYASKEYVDAVR